MSLTQNAAQGADGNLGLLRHNHSIHNIIFRANEFDVAALLADLHKAGSFQPALDLAVGLRLSRANLYLDRAHLGRARGLRRLEMEFHRFFQVGESLFFRLPLLAISTSRHCETYHFPSRQTVAANGRFMTSFFL